MTRRWRYHSIPKDSASKTSAVINFVDVFVFAFVFSLPVITLLS
jgi:hypothetical protein